MKPSDRTQSVSAPRTPLSLLENSCFFVQSGAFYRALPLLSLVAVARAVNVDPRHQSVGSGRPKWVTAGPGGGCPPIGAEAGREAGLHPVSPFWEESGCITLRTAYLAFLSDPDVVALKVT